ncbi:hypothetical protein LOD99_748 [Oopsacas minuta]|uniref:Supervillin n=1 Tax=Oopsacas minuta TaxID=111878 RepID=A0AAV7JZK3_9METZ|nr:hypothetical protein LOD99_748 [Oopsacas minuta]
MVELIRIETKINDESDTKQLAKSAAENYRSFLKSRAVFAPEGDLGQRGRSGGSHSFKARRFSEVKALTADRPEAKPRRSHSSDNILEEVQRYEQNNEHVLTQGSFETGDTHTNVKRSKFEYIKQLFSKKPDKPRKCTIPTLFSPSQAPRIFHRPSDATSNYSTSDYASDQELDDTTVYSKQLTRSPIYANRNSKIASIVKRFEPQAQTDNPITSTGTPPSELVERTHSQSLLEIRTISSNLSSLMTNLSSFSAIDDSNQFDSKPTKKLVVETLMEPKINEDKQQTPKITTSYSLDVKQHDFTVDNCRPSEHGDDVISLDELLTNLAPPKRPVLPSHYTLVPREEESDSDSTVRGPGSLNNSTDILLEEVNKTVAEMTSSIQCNETADPIPKLERPPYIDINSKQLSSIDGKITRVMGNLSPDVKHRNICPPSLLPVHTHTNMTSESTVTPQNTEISQDSEFNVTSSLETTEDILIPNFNEENALSPFLTSKESDLAVEMKSVKSSLQIVLNFDSKPNPNHRHVQSCDDGDVAVSHHPLSHSTTLDDLTTSPLLPTRSNILDTQPTDYSDVTSTHSMSLSPINKHKYTGYSLPSGQTASVSDRIRFLMSKSPIDDHKVDKLTIARAAIERKKSEAKPAYARPVLIELSQPEEFSFKSLRERFEVKMKQMEPSGVMLSPSQLPPPARKKSEDLGIKPIFAGDTKKFSSTDVIAMRNEYNTDGDANTNKSLVQPRYIIK